MPKASLALTGDRIEVRFPYSPVMVEAVKQVDHRRRWVPNSPPEKGGRWTFPCETIILRRLMSLFGLSAANLDNGLRDLIGDDIVSAPPVDLSVLDGLTFKTQPYEHQRVNLARLLTNNVWALFDEMGTGKTWALVNRLKIGFERDEFKRVLVLSPKSVTSVWPLELEKHAGMMSGLQVVIVRAEGAAHDKQDAYEAVLDWVDRGHKVVLITNYESLLTRGSTRGVDNFLQFDPEVVIAEEAHRAKTLTTKTSQKLRLLCREAQVEYRWALTGTPAPNSPLDVFGILAFLDPKILGIESKVALEARYAIKGDAPTGGKMIVGYKDLDDLAKRVASCSSRVTKAEALDLPAKTFVIRTCDLDGEQKRVYRELRKDAIARLQQARQDSVLTIKNVLTESLRLLQVVGGHVPDDAGQQYTFTRSAKMDLLRDILEDVEPPLVIWACFIRECEEIAEYIKTTIRSDCGVLMGQTPPEERQRLVDSFQKRDLPYLVGTPQTGGMGITLTAASQAIYYSRSFNAGDWWQSQDRIHRVGTTRPVTIMSLVATGTVDEKVHLALERKAELQELLMTTDIDDLL
jgi:SNF2 family DNA or RNA helicase